MEELSFDIPLVQCSKCNYDFMDGDIIYYDRGTEGYLEIEDILNCKYETIYCEECKDVTYCKDCDNPHENCECLI